MKDITEEIEKVRLATDDSEFNLDIEESIKLKKHEYLTYLLVKETFEKVKKEPGGKVLEEMKFFELVFLTGLKDVSEKVANSIKGYAVFNKDTLGHA